MVNASDKVGVVYLMWVPYGITYFNAFINFYIEHPAGIDHQLLIVFNGVEGQIPEQYLNVLQQYKITCSTLIMNTGQDIDAYRYAAEQMDVEFILFMNTYSAILADNWLKKYIDVFVSPKTGVVSATASNQSHYSTVFSVHKIQWESEKGFSHNFRKYKLFLKVLFYWRFLFKPFPCPHIRTNAFAMRRRLFLELAPQSLQNKFKAYQFESGRNSLTAQCLKRGLTVLVIDKNGNTYSAAQWKGSNTYRISNQENLIVSDNQTKLYEESPEEQRKWMTKMAWGS